MAFEASAAALGNLVFGECCQEASGRPAFSGAPQRTHFG
jgi:hypothetical protein